MALTLQFTPLLGPVLPSRKNMSSSNGTHGHEATWGVSLSFLVDKIGMDFFENLLIVLDCKLQSLTAQKCQGLQFFATLLRTVCNLLRLQLTSLNRWMTPCVKTLLTSWEFERECVNGGTCNSISCNTQKRKVHFNVDNCGGSYHSLFDKISVFETNLVNV